MNEYGNIQRSRLYFVLPQKKRWIIQVGWLAKPTQHFKIEAVDYRVADHMSDRFNKPKTARRWRLIKNRKRKPSESLFGWFEQ